MANQFIEEDVPINGIFQYFLHAPVDSKTESKDVVLMLHGGPGLANSYIAYYLAPYANFCNMVYYDQRGAGKTQLKNQTQAEALTMEALLEDLRQTVTYVTQKYDTRRVFLAGHSWGSMLGTQYILRHPHTVAGYIGYGQSVSDAAQSRSWYKFLKEAIAKAGDPADMAAFAQVDQNFPAIGPEAYFNAYAVLGELGMKYDYMAADIYEIYGNSPTWTAADEEQAAHIEALNKGLYENVLYGEDIRHVKTYQTPVYYVLGRYDEMTSSVLAAEYFETIAAPKKGLYWIENAGHLVDTDNPADFFAAVEDIVART